MVVTSSILDVIQACYLLEPYHMDCRNQAPEVWEAVAGQAESRQNKGWDYLEYNLVSSFERILLADTGDTVFPLEQVAEVVGLVEQTDG
jgi:hypothetical protein